MAVTICWKSKSGLTLFVGYSTCFIWASMLPLILNPAQMRSYTNPDFIYTQDLYCEPASPTAIGIPIKEELIVVSCSLCSRPVLHSGFSKHFVTCKKASLSGKSKTAKFSNGLVTKKKKQNGSTSTSVAGFTLSGGPSTSLSSSSTSVFSEITPWISPASLKTPKAESSKESTKKVKGGPINLDLQCGVMHDNGLPCARSITCKIHSVSLKRAVAGRTHPYDSLYQEYQAKALLARGFKGCFYPNFCKH
ncbi:SAGA complex subunit Sgf73 [Batrachochytrium dendrobatidis]|nr:SAGA complex subunit Sgf73 [Batrachochytrium dendrobatidis]